MLLRALFFFVTFCPAFYFAFGSAGATIVSGCTLLLLIFIIAYSGKKISFLNAQEKMFIALFGACMAYYFFMIAINLLLFSQKAQIFDLLDFYRPPLYLLSAIIPFIFIKNSFDCVKLDRTFMLLFFWVSLFGVVSLFGAAHVIGPLYVKKTNMVSGRVTMPFVNPYDYAYFMSFFTVYFLHEFLKKSSWSNFFKIFISALLIMLTQSRTGFIILGAMVFFISIIIIFLQSYSVLLRFKLNSKHFKMIVGLFFVFVFVGSTFYVFFDHFKYLASGMSFLSDNKPKSFTARQDQVNIAIDRAIDNPYVMLFGNGPLKGEMKDLESIYAYYGFRYGLIGFFVLFFLPWFFGIYYSFRAYQFAPQDSFWFATCAWIMVLPIAGFGSNFNEQSRISFYYFFLLGCSVRGYSIQRNEYYKALYDGK